ncbi:hypothetical protein RclHR1_05600011 [Rhizophagus clarus]|uniref:Uncharacterized protein n=1 Tax=Rhizophagus clarus TaxID=94130 RepID=A0A2Z6RPY5_9GLOM|nr:hypothetical protein RclHR1_05600011 [Rhizophagus clarus]
MSVSSDNNDFFNETQLPLPIKKKKKQKKNKKAKKTPTIAPPPTTPSEISLGAPWEYFYEDIITYIIMENFQGITASPV